MRKVINIIGVTITVALLSGTSTFAVAADTNTSNMLKPVEIASVFKLENKQEVKLKSTSEILSEVEQKLKLEKSEAEQAEEKATKAAEDAKKLAEEKAAISTEIEQLKARIAQAEAEIAEKARQRELAAAQAAIVPVAPTYTAQATAPTVAARGVVSGNGYAPGYCTYYVKNRRPDIGNQWGNANQWLYSAQAAGYATGPTPVPGAIAVQGNHVAYVESVQGDTATISEMNYGGLWRMNTRTVPASSFYYIY